MTQNDIYRLNERFVKDFAVKMDVGVASSEYFKDRLSLWEAHRPGTIEKYNEFISYVQSNFKTVDDFYIARNNFSQTIISDQEDRQERFGLKGNKLEEYQISQDNISSADIYKETNLSKTLISIDLKSASFQALKLFNSEIVRNAKDYPEYVSMLTDYKYFDNKRIRSIVFGKTCNKQIYKIEKFITRKVVDIVLQYEDISNIVCYNSDEVVFVKTANLKNILRDIDSLSKSSGIIFDEEEFYLTKIDGISRGFLKHIIDLKTNEKRIDICGVSAINTTFVLCALYKKEIIPSYLYFKDNDGYLCKFIEYPQVSC